ncbi:MAG TPA: MetQ/NlpA family ABC transporter substrate-binding protein [Anaerolineales bacterium]
MKFRYFHLYFISLILIASTILGACASTAATPGQVTEPVTIKFAVLPILDALPMYVAQQEGYFSEHGVELEFIPVSSAAERDQIMAAGQADAMINDIVSTLFYNQDGTQIEVVRFARTATPDFPQYRILAAGNSGITAVDDLKGVEIGISEGSVIAYTTDRLLETAGFAPNEITTIAVPNIADRLALLNSGELKAANLPDPLASLAIQNGAVAIIDDTTRPDIGNSLISFRKAFIDENPQAVNGFLAAVERAANDINADTTQWEGLLTEQQLVPAPLIGAYQIPTFPTASVPSEAQWEDVLAWAKEKGLVTVDVSYQDSVNDSFLP